MQTQIPTEDANDKEIELLCRVAIDHLYLTQFEAFRAIIITLRSRNPDLALSILQTVVCNAGRFPNILYSTNCSSPALLTWLTTLELLTFHNSTSPLWSFDPLSLRLRAEFCLLVQNLIEIIENDEVNELEFNESTSRVLRSVLVLGFTRLKSDAARVKESGGFNYLSLSEEKLVHLRGLILARPDLFEALSDNVEKQVKGSLRETDDSGLAITTVRREGEKERAELEEEENGFLKLLQRTVQKVHLEVMKEETETADIDNAVKHIKHLRLDYGLPEEEYRMVLQDLLQRLLSVREKGFEESWHTMEEKLLYIYIEALSSRSTRLVQLIEIIHDGCLSEEIEKHRSLHDNQIPLPLARFQRYIADMKPDSGPNSVSNLSLNMAINICLRDMYHYARLSGIHVLDSVMHTVLSAIKSEQLNEASSVLMLYPRLQPLAAVMGWDLLSGKTAARRRLMRLLWISHKSHVSRLEDSSLYGDESDEISCIDHLCDSLCYQLDLASFVARVNSGQSWNSKSSLLLSAKGNLTDEHDDAPVDPFVENFVLERLSVQSPLRVLFDVVPGIKFKEAIELISMQPISSSIVAWNRMQDIELVHMRYALEATVLALGYIARLNDESIKHHQMAIYFLKDLQIHLQAISSIPRKIMMVNIIISLLHMDDASTSPPQTSSLADVSSYLESPDIRFGENKMVVSFTGMLLDLLYRNLPTTEHVRALDTDIALGAKQALEWRIRFAKHFLEDWQWRLSILQRLLPLSDRQWNWKEALTVLRAAPSKLLNLCMQRAKYDIGEEAVHRFSLPPEDRAILRLVEWVDSAFRKASVEDVLSQAADGNATVQELDFTSLRAQLGTLSTILLCLDIAATSARSANVSQQLLNQAQGMLSEIYPGGSPRIGGSTYWDQIHEVGLISVTRRVLKRLHEYMEQDKPPALQAILSGEILISSVMESQRYGQRERALAMLHQMIEDAHKGRRQFLSGKLHNLARAVADEETETSAIKGESSHNGQKGLVNLDEGGVLGLGLKKTKQMSSSTSEEKNMQPVGYDIKDNTKHLYGSLTTKPTTYLSQFILHIAAIGDIVDGTDTTHDFNFFSLVYERPKDLLTRLVFDRGNTDAAEKVAEIMNADFVHEVISACVPPVYPPRSGNGWARIPVTPTPVNSIENKVLSPSKETKTNRYSCSSAIPGVPLYPLELDIVKHLVKLSPVRAVLACVFGSTILYSGNDSSILSSFNNGLLPAPDVDRLFYEFALDQSERFPTLNRWIQMQTNLHRVSEFATTAKHEADDNKTSPEIRVVSKRLREQDSDTESEIEDVISSNVSTALPGFNSHNVESSNTLPDTSRSDVGEPNTVFLSLDWENEAPYEKAVERLIEDGKLMDALALSDRFLRNGVSDKLLQLIIEQEEEKESISIHPQSYACHRIWSDSWKYCLRLRDKHLAARLALRNLNQWELDAALDVLTMCSFHLHQSDPLRNLVMQKAEALKRYTLILSADDQYNCWQEVEAECKEDPEGLALRLAGKGAVSAALEVAESAGLSIDLRRELQGRQLVKLLTADPLHGGGPAEASRFLSSLRDSDDALPVAMGAMQLLPNLRSKQLLVHFFLKRKDGNLSDAEVSRLNSWALGLRVLAALPLPWQQRCSSLHEHPQLILEVLLMRKQLQSASLILKAFPSLRDNNMVLVYAAKAVAVSTISLSGEPHISVMGPRPRQKTKTGGPTKSSFSSSLSNLQKEARRAFSWAPRNTGDKPTPKDVDRKRKSSGLTPSERVAWEEMAGIQEEHVPSYNTNAQERLPSVSIADEWMLTGDAIKDEVVRSSHRYESAPDIILFKALLALCSDESVSAKGALDLCVNQMKNVLNSQQLPESASMEIIGRAYHATEAFVQGLLYAKSQLRKLAGAGAGAGADITSNSERKWDADDTSSDAGSSSLGSQTTDEFSDVISQAESWLGRAELLQSLLGSGIAVSLDDIADKESSARLRDRLIVDERYSMAVYTSKKCKIDVFPVWNAWGHALIRMEHYAQARVKFKQALQLLKGDPATVILDIIHTIEGGPPVDVSSVRSMYEHLARSAPTILDDSLSADSYLNVLYMPSTFPRSERSRRFQESANNSSTSSSEFDDGPRSNLDSIRYQECVNYLQEYARQHLLTFMFRHGHYKDACLLFFPLNAIPLPPQPSSLGVIASSSSPQKTDPLANDYGTIDDLCDLCIGYGVMSVLEEVTATRISATSPQDVVLNQYTSAALSRICIYCETHKHFNYLYKFQVIRNDHVAAGLCCIQLFVNASSQEEATKYLENAKMHFDMGLSARYKSGDSTKVITKGVRGKTASEKLSEEGLVKFSARVAVQVDVVKAFNDTDAPQWKHSLFGNPNDPETYRRRCEIAEALAEKNFDLAFQVIYEFNLPAVDIYAGVAASLAERKRGGQLTDFFRNIKGTIDEEDWDQVLGAAINVYASKHKERPDRLIDMLTSSHRKVLACVVCGRLKSAFQIASRSGSVADVQYVAHQALHANALPVLDMCKQWLAQYM